METVKRENSSQAFCQFKVIKTRSSLSACNLTVKDARSKGHWNFSSSLLYSPLVMGIIINPSLKGHWQFEAREKTASNKLCLQSVFDLVVRRHHINNPPSHVRRRRRRSRHELFEYDLIDKVNGTFQHSGQSGQKLFSVYGTRWKHSHQLIWHI